MTDLQATIGSHRFHMEGDVVVGKLRGNIHEDHAVQIFALLRQISDQHGPYFLLTDLSELGTIEPAARRAMTRQTGVVGCRASAIYGASLVARTVVTLVVRAIEMVHRPSDSPTRFFKTETEARAFLDQLRNGKSV
jgi:hypothetical protein